MSSGTLHHVERGRGTPLVLLHPIGLVIVPGAPHMVQIECADRFAASVTDFLAG